MSEGNHIEKFSAAVIEKYHKGLLTAKEMHELEKAALEDPFLADALEGYALPDIATATDLQDLKNRLDEKTSITKVIQMKTEGGGRKIPWLRVAAAVLLVAGAGIVAQKMLMSTQKTNEVAQHKEKNNSEQQVAPATVNDTVQVGNATATNNNTATISATKNNDHTDSKDISISSNNGGNGTTLPQKTIEKVAEKKEEAAGKLSKPEMVVTNSPNAAQNDAKVVNTETAVMNKTAKDIASKRNNAVQPIPDIDKDGVNDVFDDSKNRQATNNASVANNARKQRSKNVEPHIFNGRVTDENNIGLPFARVLNTADNNAGTYTDVKGYFTITYPDTVVNVRVNSVGFDNSNVELQSSLSNNNVTLQNDKNVTAVVIDSKKINTEKRRNITISLTESEPMDGWDNYDTYITNNLDKPDEFKSKPSFSSGTVDVSFEVNKYGEPVNFKIEKSLCKKCDKEAIRLVKVGPKWRSNANKNGRTTVTISF
ncbi:MAG TPA: carboxypeptidase-like regulatory domain-containing protein [Chitinophagaceae bacterium]|nr:carboxypeptidase-like regulatory domain-containing protein [Chitinophagaceae bacterium]